MVKIFYGHGKEPNPKNLHRIPNIPKLYKHWIDLNTAIEPSNLSVMFLVTVTGLNPEVALSKKVLIYCKESNNSMEVWSLGNNDFEIQGIQPLNSPYANVSESKKVVAIISLDKLDQALEILNYCFKG